MGAPALVNGSKIKGLCTMHQIVVGTSTAIKPPSGFSAPISKGTIASVLIGGEPAAVINAFGYNERADTHTSIVDPPFAGGKLAQIGTVRSGSPTVLIGGQMAATTASLATCCVATDKATGFDGPVTSVEIG